MPFLIHIKLSNRVWLANRCYERFDIDIDIFFLENFPEKLRTYVIKYKYYFLFILLNNKLCLVNLFCENFIIIINILGNYTQNSDSKK